MLAVQRNYGQPGTRGMRDYLQKNGRSDAKIAGRI